MAITATAVWEIRPTAGSDTNGGGFDASIASAGTDYSQQNAAQVAVTNAVTNNTTTVTSATGGFTSAMIGNAVYLSGTGTTTGRYFVTAVGSSTSITVDRATGSTGGTGVTLNLGGALATNNEAFSARGGVTSNIFWLKSSGAQLIAGTQTSPPVGTSAARTILIGYNSSRSAAGATLSSDLDNVYDFSNFPSVTANNVASSSVVVSNDYITIRNLATSGGSGGTKGANGFNQNTDGASVQFINCKASGFTTAGFASSSTTGVTYLRCYATANVAGATAGFNLTAGGSAFAGCVASGLTCPGFILSASAYLFFCVAANNSGASSDGFQFTGGVFSRLINCIAYANGRDGLRITGAGTGDGATVWNNIFAANSGFDAKSNTTNLGQSSSSQFNYNAYYTTGSGARSQIIAGANDVTLTGDPFTNGASGDFSLNNAAGGLACRAAGFPGTMPGGTSVGYLDIGAVQRKEQPSPIAAIVRNIGGSIY